MASFRSLRLTLLCTWLTGCLGVARADSPVAAPPAASPTASPAESVEDAQASDATESDAEGDTAEHDAPTLTSVEITGKLREKPERLSRFIGLQVGQPFTRKAAARTRALLRQLGYRVTKLELDGTGRLRIELDLIRVVFVVRVVGQFPYFSDEILRHLSLRQGSEIDDEKALPQRLADEAKNIERFLDRDGYFGSKVTVEEQPTKMPGRIDLLVRVKLGSWYRLGSVEVRGSNVLKPSELFDSFDHCCFALGRFRPLQLRNDARAAEKKLRERGYPGARVEPDFSIERDVDPSAAKVRLPLDVNEKRRVEVVLIGNRRIPTRDLRSELTLFSGVGYSRRDVEENAELLQRAAQRRGFFEAKVEYRIKRRPDDSDLVEFLIEEGQELRVRAIDFQTQDGSELPIGPELIRKESGIETKVFPRLGVIGLGEGGYVTTLQLRQDEERIAEYLRQHGYPEVKVRGEVARDPSTFGALGALGAEVAKTTVGNNLYVRFFIEPGRHEVIDNVDIVFVGEHQKDEATIRSMLKELLPGRSFTEAQLDADQVRILELYKAAGRPYVVISSNLDWNPTHDRLRLKMSIDEGTAVKFGEILVRGNFRTSERVILKDLPFKRGDTFDLRKIEEGERNLQNHLIFNSAKVTPVGLDGNPGEVPILVQVQERFLERFGTLGGFLGVQTDRLPYYAYVGASYQWNNFAGLGSQLEVRGDFGWINSFGVSGRYSDLYAFGPGWRFDLTLFYRREVTRRLGPIEAFGGSIGITRAISRALRVFTRLDVIRSQLSVTFLRLNGPGDTPTLQDNTLTTKLVFGVMWDRRTDLDGVFNPLMPQKGWLLAATAAWAPPYVGDNHFVSLSGQAMGLLPMRLRGEVFTLIGNLRYDHGIPINAAALPAVERFFAGGDTTTRGYGTDQLKTEIVTAEVPPLGDSSGFRVIPQGGNVRFLSTVELQFPIAKSFLGLPVQWVGAVFWDVGAILSDWRLVQRNDFKQSVGISLLRLLTPFGPLSLEYAYPLNQSLAEQTWKTSPWYSHFPGRIHFNWQIPLTRF